MTTRNAVVFYLNEKRFEVTGEHCLWMLSDFLRYERGLVGTKVVCAEGDCGACTILLASIHDLSEGRFSFKPVNSCILPVFSLDGCFLITVEGLRESPELHPVQAAMIENFGSQCGYCTPGFVCAMAALAEDSIFKKKPITEKRAKNSMTGNLCRCTGYEPIINAALALNLEKIQTQRDRFGKTKALEDLKAVIKTSVETSFGQFRVFMPVNLPEALKIKDRYPDTVIVAGSTDLGVLVNKGRAQLQSVMSLQNISELRECRKEKDFLRIPSRVTLSALHEYFQGEHLEMAHMLNVFASPQIKNSATLVGNVVNASPISDSIPFLLVSDAEVEIQSSGNQRLIPIAQFFLGYKKLDLKKNEIVTAIHLPHPLPNSKIKLYKVSLRKDLDISAVTMALHIQLDGTKVTKARLAFGGVGPVVLRMTDVENQWTGEDWNPELLLKAAEEIHQHINPLTDVRGSREYRLLLCKNLLKKCADELEIEVMA